MSYRLERINEMIKTEISSVINYQLNDPRLKDAQIMITSVATTPDMKYSKIFVAMYTQNQDKKEILEIIKKAKGFLRKQLSQVLTTRYTPELLFEIDNSTDYAIHIDEVLKTLDIKEEEENEDQ